MCSAPPQTCVDVSEILAVLRQLEDILSEAYLETPQYIASKPLIYRSLLLVRSLMKEYSQSRS